MKNHNIYRRRFLKSSLIGGVSALILTNNEVLGETVESSDTNTPCVEISAATLLAFLSTLAWKLPNKAKELQEKQKIESELFTKFTSQYNELVKLAENLDKNCKLSSHNEPRVQEILDLVKTGQKNIKFINASSSDTEIAFLHLTTLTVANQQIARTANELQPLTEIINKANDEIICQILGKIKQLESIRTELNDAREKFKGVFKDFFDSLGNLNRTILDASEYAAREERGESSNEKALIEISNAKKVLEKIEKDSNYGDDDSVDPETLLDLLAVPENMLKGNQSTTQNIKDINVRYTIQNVSFGKSPRYVQDDISEILKKYIRPSDAVSISLLTLFCDRVLKLYTGDPPREKNIRGTIKSHPFLDPKSDVEKAVKEISKL